MPHSRQSPGRGRYGCFRHRAVLFSADQAARNLTFVAGAGWRQLTLHCKPVVMLPIVFSRGASHSAVAAWFQVGAETRLTRLKTIAAAFELPLTEEVEP